MPTLEDNDSKIDNSYAEGRGGYGEHPENDGSFTSADAEKLRDIENNMGENTGVNAGIDQAEAYANDPVNTTKNSEENPMNFTGAGSSSSEKGSFNFKGALKKKGPMGLIIGLLLGGVGGLTMFFTPGLAVVQIKEMLTEDLNDQMAAMDIRTTHVFKAKLNDMKSGALCSNITPAKCKFKGMSERQIKKFKAAGIDVEFDEDKTTLTGKKKVTSLSMKDSSGNTIKIDKPADINKLLGDRVVRNAFRKAFNPKFAGLYDKVSAKVLNDRFKTSKSNKLSGTTEEEMAKNIDDSVAGKTVELEAKARDTTDESTEEEKERNKAGSDYFEKQKERITSGSGLSRGFGSGLSSAVKGVGALGAVDTACTVYNTSRAVSAGAKVIRAAQLAGYAMVFLNFADQVKAGTATPEQAEFVGNNLTSIDTEKEVYDETSGINDSDNSLKNKVANPYYQENAFDSEGYRASAYNDASTLTARAAQFSIGGGLIGRLSSINATIDKYTGGSTDKCDIVQNPVVRGGSLVVGIIAGIGSGGATLALSIGGSVAIGMAIPILESYLTDMIAGKTVDSKTKGVDSGNAIFAGTAAILGATAMARGMKPLNKSEIKSYQKVAQGVKEEYIAMETEDAKSTPFDIYNQYSFAGSLVRKINPSVAGISSNTSVAVAKLPTLFSTAVSSVIPSTYAVGDYNEARYSKCADEGYKKIGIDADIFCNVRYGLSQKELTMDTDAVVDYMYNKGHIDDDGDAKSDVYKKWLEQCVNRTSGWGDTPDGQENGGEGYICADKNDGGGELSKDEKERNSYFRVYTMDSSINDAMEYEPEATTSTDGSLKVMSYNICNPDNDCDNGAKLNVTQRAETIAKTIGEKSPDILGTQEGGISSKLKSLIKSDYASNDTTDKIYWKKGLFTKTSSGTFTIKAAGANENDIQEKDMPWVKLKSTSGGEVYVINVHPDVKYGANRTDAAKTITNLVKTKMTDAPVIIMGDMNSGYPGHPKADNEVYDVFSNAKYTLTYNTAKQKTKQKCATTHNIDQNPDCSGKTPHIDHIYYTNASGAVVNSWENVIDENTKASSDHNPVLVNLTIPGLVTDSSGSAATGEVTWPVDGKLWKADSSKFKKAHGGCGTFTGGGCIDLGFSKGTDVFAIAGGTVTKKPLGRSSYQCTGNPNSSNNGGLMIESKIQGGTLLTAYAHGYDVTSDSTVTTGQKIMELGQVGNACGSHLHIDMTFNGKPICPQDVFIALGDNKTPNFEELTKKTIGTCGR